MNYKGILLFFICFFIISCHLSKNIHITVFNERQKELLDNYILIKNYNINVIDNGNYIILNKINEKILIDILGMLNLKMDIIKDNIVNVNTTRTYNGEPFLRNYLKITAENGIEILKDNSPIRLVYDPIHPDTILDGENKGYVQYSNVDLVTEYYDLIETIQLYNSIVDFIKNNYKQITVEKLNMITIDEVEYDI